MPNQRRKAFNPSHHIDAIGVKVQKPRSTSESVRATVFGMHHQVRVLLTLKKRTFIQSVSEIPPNMKHLSALLRLYGIYDYSPVTGQRHACV